MMRLQKFLALSGVASRRSSITTDTRTGDLVAAVEATASYSAYIEWGTSKMQPQPFMRPAQERNTPGFLEAISQLAEGV